MDYFDKSQLQEVQIKFELPVIGTDRTQHIGHNNSWRYNKESLTLWMSEYFEILDESLS